MIGPTEAKFGNTIFSRGFSFTFAKGVAPSVCYVYTVPHTPGIPSVADLLFQLTGAQQFVFTDCLLEQPQLNVGQGGRYWTLPILDRRWKWRFGNVWGHYNVRKADGTLVREKTPQELASLCFDEMGEFGYDVSRLPNTQRPEVNWTNGPLAATELDQLCISLGCEPGLNPLTNRAEIWKTGEGSPLPTGGTRGASYTPIQPAIPSRIEVQGGPTLFQATFACEAVGIDTDGRFKPINDLSYKPAVGWNRSAVLSGFPEVTGTYREFDGRILNKRDLAQASVFKAYRVNGVYHAVFPDFKIPLLKGTPLEPQGLSDVVLFGHKADEEISTEDGGIRRLPAAVYVYHAQMLFKVPIFPVAVKRHAYDARFDPQHGIVWFNEPTFQLHATGFIHADVYVECAFHAGRAGVLHRHSITQDTNTPWSTPTHVIQRPDIHRTVIYRNTNGVGFQTYDDEAAATGLLNPWLESAQSELNLQQGGTVRYDQLIPIAPDGLTQQITWSGGGTEPATTTVSQGQRHNRLIPPPDRDRERREAIETRKRTITIERQLGANGILQIGGI